MSTSAKRATVGAKTTVFEQLSIADTSDIKKRTPSKNGRVMMPFLTPVASRSQLKMMAIEMESTQQDLMTAALNDFYRKHSKPPIA